MVELWHVYGKYIASGVAAIVGLAILLWLLLVFSVMTTTQGVPKAISNFFKLIIEENTDRAYQLTTKNFQSKTSKKQFLKFIKTNKFSQYKRTLLAIPMVEGDRADLDVTLILYSGKEIPLKISLLRQDKEWQIDLLEVDKSKK